MDCSTLGFPVLYYLRGNGNPLQCSCLENPRGGRAWWAVVYGVSQSQTWLKQLSSSSSSSRVCSNSCPLSWWCYLTISSSAVPFSYCLQSLLASGSFPMSWLFPSSDQKYWSFSFNKSPSNEYSELIFFRIDWLDLAVQGDSWVFSSTTVQKHQFFGAQLSIWSNSHIHTCLLEKP